LQQAKIHQPPKFRAAFVLAIQSKTASGIPWTEVFNMFEENAVEKSRTIFVSDSSKGRFTTLHWSKGWHFRGRTRE
jgi:hypothetical protein